MLGPILVSLHNITFYQKLTTQIRLLIEKNEFAGWAEKQLKKQQDTNTETI